LTRAELKNVKFLLSKKGRRDAGQYSAEGIRLLEEAVRSKTWPEKVYYATTSLTERGQALVTEFKRRGVTVAGVSASDLERMTDAATPQGILAVFPYPSTDLTELYGGDSRNILVCENIADPGNVGTLCRSALAFGYDLVVLCGSCAEPYAPKVVRSSVGALFGLPVAVAPIDDLLALVEREQIALAVADIGGRSNFRHVCEQIKKRRLALVLCSEGAGPSDQVSRKADYLIRVRHEQKVESLNVAIAGSILMKERYDAMSRRQK